MKQNSNFRVNPINNLKKLEKVDLRKIWGKEAQDFSPWLASEEGLSLLGNEIGIDINCESVELEAPTGGLYVDVFAEETGTGKKIVIENQLEQTDHDHLGKIINYAAGHNASMIIWIFEEIKEEHRLAIDWLNEKTDEDIYFFALKINVYKIGDSNPAPKFEIVCKPNEWSKTTKGPTDIQKQYREFWRETKNYAKNFSVKDRSGKLLLRQSPQPQNWYSIAVGINGAQILLVANDREELMKCQLYITDFRLYQFLENYKTEIKKKVSKIEWEILPKSRIIQQIEKGFSLDKMTEYNSYFDWFIKQAELFYKTFTPYIEKYKKQPPPQYED